MGQKQITTNSKTNTKFNNSLIKQTLTLKKKLTFVIK